MCLNCSATTTPAQSGCFSDLAELPAQLVEHNQTATTELVYRHQIVSTLTRGAEVMEQIFG